MKISRAASRLPGSGIRAIMDVALARPGTVRLEIGDPDFGTPPHIIDAARRAMGNNFNHYVPTAGIPELRLSLSNKVGRYNKVPSSPDQVFVTHGATQGILLALQAIANPGDEVLIPDPAWPNYIMMTRLLQLEERRYPLTVENSFAPNVGDMIGLSGPRTRILILNSPSNPTGSVIDGPRMTEILAFAESRDLWVISDECYDELLFDNSYVSAAAIDANRVISVFSLSKTYAMTGWRIGYIVVPVRLCPVIQRCHEATLACINGATQMAAIAAIDGPQECVAHMRAKYKERRDFMFQALQAVDPVQFQPNGAFYMWIDISRSGMDSDMFATHLLDTWNVAVAPGTAFGNRSNRYIRVSLASSDSSLSTGKNAIMKMLSSSYH